MGKGFGRTLRNYALALVAGVALMAGYSVTSLAAPCASSGTFAQLMAAGTCEIGDKTFSGFTFQSSDITAGELNYTAINGTGGFWGFSFQFDIGALGSGDSEDFLIQYDVSCTNGLACIDSVHADITGGGAGGGVASLAENYGLGSFFLFTPGGPTSIDIDLQSPVSTLHFSKDVNARCPREAPGCVVTVSGMTNTVDQVTVPEPGTLALLAGGILMLGWVGRRRNRN
jgi:hypothetical protein